MKRTGRDTQVFMATHSTAFLAGYVIYFIVFRFAIVIFALEQRIIIYFLTDWCLIL